MSKQLRRLSAVFQSMKAALATLVTLVAVAGAGDVGEPPASGTFRAAPKAKAVLHDSAGAEVGTVDAEAVGGGLRVIVKVHDMPPGEHGVHVHGGAACGSAAGPEAFAGAGGHLDPAHANSHDGLNGSGHAGDLGNILVAGDGKGKLDVVAERLDLGNDNASVAGKPVVVHTLRDNLTDKPENGGSDGRWACGVLERQ